MFAESISASKSRSLLVAAKYQQTLKEEQFDIFKKELDIPMGPGRKKKIQ